MIDFRKGKGYSPYDGDDRAERSRDYKEGFPGKIVMRGYTCIFCFKVKHVRFAFFNNLPSMR